jgi:hypothetical protein
MKQLWLDYQALLLIGVVTSLFVLWLVWFVNVLITKANYPSPN